MASAAITESKPVLTKKIYQKLKINAKFIDVPGKVKVSQVLPFRVKFTTLGLNAYGPGNAAPIGIAVIGFNNYVL